MKELDRDTVRDILVNVVSSLGDLDEDNLVQRLSETLSSSTGLASGETQRLIRPILIDELEQLQYQSVDEDGAWDRDQAMDYLIDKDPDHFVERVMGELEKAGKLTFKDTEPNTFLTNPDKPLTTFKELREKVLLKLSTQVWWLDKQFGPEGFDYLPYFDPKKVIEIRILAGPGKVDNKFKKQYIRAMKELGGKHINLQARVILQESLLQEIHDRYLAGDNAAYSVPPVNILADKLATVSELSQEDSEEIRSRFKKYWQNSVDPLKGNSWDSIQKARGNLKGEPGGGL